MARILVVDDEEDVRDMVRLILEPHGYEITEAADGEEGLQRYREAPADLVLSDFRMPVMDGPTMIGELRKAYPKVKIIVFAGIAVELTEAAQLGADQVLKKPFRVLDLLEMVKKLLGEQD